MASKRRKRPLKRNYFVTVTNSLGNRIVRGPFTRAGAKRELKSHKKSKTTFNPRIVARRGRTLKEIYKATAGPVRPPSRRKPSRRKPSRRKPLKVFLVTFAYEKMKRGKVIQSRQIDFVVTAASARNAKNAAQRWTKKMAAEENEKWGWTGKVPWTRAETALTKRKPKHKAGNVEPR